MDVIEFPKMIYHCVEPPVIVKDKEEEQAYLAKGWSTTLQTFDEIKALKAKIAYHQSEVTRLEDILLEIEGENFVCDVCQYEAKSAAGLSAHKRSHVGKEVAV
jgi:hypothetical protein